MMQEVWGSVPRVVKVNHVMDRKAHLNPFFPQKLMVRLTYGSVGTLLPLNIEFFC